MAAPVGPVPIVHHLVVAKMDMAVDQGHEVAVGGVDHTGTFGRPARWDQLLDPAAQRTSCRPRRGRN
jgi:hypothetical protein